ncbi:MAG: AAA family ATPase, partial [Phycisphaerales bacterium]|nr:AAA family ATPase [Phycisphaerales bacterium]
PAAPSSPARSPSSRAPLAAEPRHRLDDFVVGECNRIAYTAACAIADGTAPARFSPMFLHGSCGVGKTHLLQGLAVRASKRLGAGRVKYITAEAFTNDFVAAVRANKADAFRKAFRDVEILCIDDVHFFGSKQATQAELLHTLDTLGHAGRMVVLAGDESPRDIRQMAESLRSRFLSGAVIQVDSPDDATRVELVRRLSASRGLALDDGAVSLLAERAGRPLPGGSSASVRDIQGLLTRVEAAHRLILGGDRGGSGVIDRSMVARALGLTSVGGGESRRPVPIALILERVCRSLRVDASDLMGRGRHARVVLARALVTYLARRLTTMSYPEIARSMNRPNHSTVITAFNRVVRQMAEGETVAGGSDMVDVTIKSLAERLEREVVSVGG